MIILFQLLQFMKLLYNLVYCFTIYNYSYYISQLLTGKFGHGIWNEAGFGVRPPDSLQAQPHG